MRRTIEILAFPDVQLLDVTGPLQVFASANDALRAKGAPPAYATSVVAEAAAITSSAGLGLATAPLSSPDIPVDTLIIPGGAGVYAAAADPRLTGWTRTKAASAGRVVSVCSGAFLLAETGLLDGHRAVTHWAHCAELARRFPKIKVDPDPVFIASGRVWTSAGVTAGIDLALAIVEAEQGGPLALSVARQLVMFMKRPGGQAQFSGVLALQEMGDRFAALHAFIAKNPAMDLSVPVLAEAAGMSERGFARHYRAATGTTPAQAVERLRVDAARTLLVDTRLPVKRIAARCGFGSEETMRRGFLRVLNATPRDYRGRFSSQHTRSTDARPAAGIPGKIAGA